VGTVSGTARAGATPSRARGKRSAKNWRSSMSLVSEGMAVSGIGPGDQSRRTFAV